MFILLPQQQALKAKLRGAENYVCYSISLNLYTMHTSTHTHTIFYGDVHKSEKAENKTKRLQSCVCELVCTTTTGHIHSGD